MRDSPHPLRVFALARDFYTGNATEAALLDELLEQGMLNPVERNEAKAEKMLRHRVCVTWGHPTEHLVFRVS